MGQLDPDYVRQCRDRAERGDLDALCNLGRMYSTGHGVSSDLVEAHKWFNIAAARGSVQAKIYREALAADMTARQVAAALSEARQWVQSH
ncbi:MAG: hypothetical protein ACPG06_08965 [Alphaproteobacteria bacterium]